MLAACRFLPHPNFQDEFRPNSEWIIYSMGKHSLCCASMERPCATVQYFYVRSLVMSKLASLKARFSRSPRHSDPEAMVNRYSSRGAPGRLLATSGLKRMKLLMNYLRNHMAVFAIIISMLLIPSTAGTAFAASNANHHMASASAATGDWNGWRCATSHLSQPSPIGKVWKLKVIFLSGPRQGQSELSIMTFLPDGRLTATFPGPLPGSPATLPPAVDGKWCMTGPSIFRYQFKDPIMSNGRMVAYVLPRVNAYLTSATTYEGGSVGVAYSVATGLPIPGQYGVTQTLAVAS